MTSINDLINLSKTAGKDVGRYAVNGINVVSNEHGKAVYVTTDSRRMAVLYTNSEAPSRSLILAIPDLKEFPGGVHGNDIEVRVDGDDVRVVSSTASLKVNEIHGDFPDYKRIIPENRKGITVSLNPTFMAEHFAMIATFLKENSPNKKGPMLNSCDFNIVDSETAVLITANAENGKKLVILAMPITTN